MALSNPTEVAGTISTFGVQFLSTKPTSAKAKIGTGGRTKAVNEPEWLHQHLGATSSGFGERVPSGLGPQTLSKNATANSKSFGMSYAKDQDPSTAVPGPGSYATQGASIGPQMLSNNETAPTIRIGTGGRFGQFKTEMPRENMTPPAGAWRPTSGWLGDSPNYSFHGQSKRAETDGTLPGNRPSSVYAPGAGSYEMPSAFGDQPQSNRQSMPTYKIGAGAREQFSRPTSKQYHSGGHEREMLNTHSPGPTAYNPKLTGQSKIRSVRSHGFGSSDRFSDVKSPKGSQSSGGRSALPGDRFPGPGSYVV